MSYSVTFVSSFALAVAAVFAQQAHTPAALNDVSIIQMVQANVSPDLIKLAIVRGQPNFTFDSGSLIALQNAGVPDEIVKVMAARQYGQPIPGYEQKPVVLDAVTADPPRPEAFYTAVRPLEPAQKQGPTMGGVIVEKSASEDYGLQLGSVVGYGGGGLSFNSDLGTHPNYAGGLTVGVYKYVGIFGTGGYGPLLHESFCDSYSCAEAKANVYYGGAGIEGVATNRSRVVPYGKFGMAYGHALVAASVGDFSVSYSGGAPALMFGGGARIYVNRHFGVSAELLALRTIGNNGGVTYPAMTFGVFVQSK